MVVVVLLRIDLDAAGLSAELVAGRTVEAPAIAVATLGDEDAVGSPPLPERGQPVPGRLCPAGIMFDEHQVCG